MAPTPVTDAAVSALFARWFPGTAVAFVRMGGGVSTPVYRVTVDGTETYLRCAEHPGERRDAEVRAHQLALKAGIPVPEILRYEATPPELDRSATLTSAMPGIPLTEYPGDPATAMQAAGRDLARLNAIPVRGWGWAEEVDADGNIVAEHPTRQDWVAEFLTAAARLRASGQLEPHLLDAMDEAIAQWVAWPDPGTSHLSHGDADASHVYVDPDTGVYQGLIDLGELRGADRVYDLGHLLLIEPDHLPLALPGYALPDTMADIRLQAIAIATRAIAIQLDRTDISWRAHLTRRLTELLAT